MGKKISFPMGNGVVKNGYYDPTTIPAKIQAKKNATATATRMRLAAQGFQLKQVSLSNQLHLKKDTEIVKNKTWQQ